MQLFHTLIILIIASNYISISIANDVDCAMSATCNYPDAITGNANCGMHATCAYAKSVTGNTDCDMNAVCNYASVAGNVECDSHSKCIFTSDISNGKLQANMNSQVTLKNIQNGVSIDGDMHSIVNAETIALGTSKTASIAFDTNAQFTAISATGGGTMSCQGTCKILHLKMETSTKCGDSSLIKNFEGFYYCSKRNFTALGTITGNTICDINGGICDFKNVKDGSLTCGTNTQCALRDGVSKGNVECGTNGVCDFKFIQAGNLNGQTNSKILVNKGINGDVTLNYNAQLSATNGDITGVVNATNSNVQVVAKNIGKSINGNQANVQITVTDGKGKTIEGNILGGTNSNIDLNEVAIITGDVSIGTNGYFNAPLATIKGDVTISTNAQSTVNKILGKLDCAGTCETKSGIGHLKCSGHSCTVTGGGVDGNVTCENTCAIEESVQGNLNCLGQCTINGNVGGKVDCSADNVRCEISQGECQGDMTAGANGRIDINGISGNLDCSKDGSSCVTNGGNVGGNFKCGNSGYCNVNGDGNIEGSFDCSIGDTSHCQIAKGYVGGDALCGKNGICTYGSKVNGKLFCDSNAHCTVKGNVGKDVECKDNTFCTLTSDVEGSVVCGKGSHCHIAGNVGADMTCMEGSTCTITGEVKGTLTCPSDSTLGHCVCVKCKGKKPVVPPIVPDKPSKPSTNKKNHIPTADGTNDKKHNNDGSGGGWIVPVLVIVCIVAIIGGGYFVYSRKYGNNININGRRNSYQFSNVDDGNNDYRPPMQQQQDVQPENQTTVQKQPLLDLQQQDNV